VTERKLLYCTSITALFFFFLFVYSLLYAGLLNQASERETSFIGGESRAVESLRSNLYQVNTRLEMLNKRLQDSSGDAESSQISGSKLNDGYRIYCMIPSMWGKRKFKAWSALLQTWGKECDVFKIFLDPIEFPVAGQYGETLTKLPEFYIDPVSGAKAGLVVVPMVRKNDPTDERGVPLKKSCWSGGVKNPDGSLKYIQCRHIWEKVWRSWVHIAHNDKHMAEWFFKLDDDTIFFPQNMRKFLRESMWSHRDPHYFGHRLFHGSRTFISGVMVGYSQRTVELAAQKYLTMEHEYGDRAKFKHGRCVDRDGATQEVTESKCLEEINIKAEVVRDLHGFEKIALQDISEAMKFRKREGTDYWLWYGRVKTAICCSIEPVAFHPYKNPKTLIKFYQELFDRNNTVLRDKMVDRNLILNVYKNPGKHKVMGGEFGKYAEFHYLLHVREALSMNGFMK